MRDSLGVLMIYHMTQHNWRGHLPSWVACLLLACKPVTTQPEPAAVGMSVCELVLDSTQYRNTIVTVHGLVVRGFEGFAIGSQECRTDERAGALIWLEMPSENGTPYADGPTGPGTLRAVSRDSALTWINPIPVAFVVTDQWRRLDRYLRKHGAQVATVTGRFDVVQGSLVQRDQDGLVSVAGGFGHMGEFSRRIVLQRIDRVEQNKRALP
jgi:hypothetical protein